MKTTSLEHTASASLPDSSLRLKKLAFAAIFAALTYVVFTYLSIPIPTPGGKVSVHLGNAFVVLGALLLGPLYLPIIGLPSPVFASMIFESSQNFEPATMPLISLSLSPCSTSPFALVMTRPIAFASP